MSPPERPPRGVFNRFSQRNKRSVRPLFALLSGAAELKPWARVSEHSPNSLESLLFKKKHPTFIALASPVAIPRERAAKIGLKAIFYNFLAEPPPPDP